MAEVEPTDRPMSALPRIYDCVTCQIMRAVGGDISAVGSPREWRAMVDLMGWTVG